MFENSISANSFESSESYRVFNYLHDSNSILWAAGINSEKVMGRIVFVVAFRVLFFCCVCRVLPLVRFSCSSFFRLQLFFICGVFGHFMCCFFFP